jgi:hypothetical protein
MGTSSLKDLLDLLEKLKSARIYYRLSDHTHGAIMVEVAVPGERWEIEFHEDGEIGVEIFASSGGLRGQDALAELFNRFTD